MAARNTEVHSATDRVEPKANGHFSPPFLGDHAPLRSIHTSNFSAILPELGIPVFVSTYQAGKLVMLRSDGGRLNTHFRGFSKPMGLAVVGDRLAIGTSVEIWEYHNAPAVGRQLEPVAAGRALLRRLGSEHPHGADRRLRENRGRRQGDFRRAGAAGGATPRRDQQPAARDRRFICFA